MQQVATRVKWTEWKNEGGWKVELFEAEGRKATITLSNPDGEKRGLNFEWDQVAFARNLAEDMAEAAGMRRV